jgi:hypothetical protein
MEGEDMLSIKVSSHLVQVYDTGILVPDLGRTGLGRISFVRERVTHPCPADPKWVDRKLDESQSFCPIQVRPDSQTIREVICPN